MPDPRTMYDQRPMNLGFPELDRLAAGYFIPSMAAHVDDEPRFSRILLYLDRLRGPSPGATACVLGCGPVPQPLRLLLERGWNAVGIEPVEDFVRSANEFVGTPGTVRAGVAEAIPLPDASQDVVFFENVLEHVDSPRLSLTEIHRVLKPGGIAYVTTTNRLRISLIGHNDEYRVPFYNWAPKLIKESYVFLHLHYRPELANFTERPAVHWFSYADLCALGRDVGFSSFYSPLDCRRPEDALVSGNPLKRLLQGSASLLGLIQRNALFRSLALTQVGSDIFMCRRGSQGEPWRP